jgi:Flp pilus assembly pilin Flp
MIDRSRLRLALLRRRAAGMVEYGALAALIAVAALGAVLMLGQRITDMLGRAADVLTSPVFAWSGGGTFTLTSPTGNPSVVDRTFTLTNIGSVAGTPEVPTVSGSGPGYVFSLVAHDCNRVLAVGETCSATVRATYTDNVAAATGTLDGPATVALAGSAAGCLAGNQVFTTSGTFTRPPFFQDCTVRILAVGGGGGGGIGQGGRGIAGGGGASGRVSQTQVPASTLPVGPISVTVGMGGAGGIIPEELKSGAATSWNGPWNGQHGGASSFGDLLTAAGGAGGLGGVCWWSHPLCDWSSTLPGALMYGTGGGASGRLDGYVFAGSAGGAAGRNGASNGGSTSNYPGTPINVLGATGQGPFPLSGFSQRSVAAGAGGSRSLSTAYSPVTIPGRGTFTQDTADYRRGGGGGGGVTISGATPAQSAGAGTSVPLSDPQAWPNDAWVTEGGHPGVGFGAGGGGGARGYGPTGQGIGGQGASGVVYVEWRP